MTKVKKINKKPKLTKVKVLEGEIVNGVIKVQSIKGTIQDTVAMPNRYVAKINTGVVVEVEEGFCLCFSIVSELADKGVVVANAPGRVTKGEVEITVLNAGRETVTIGNNTDVVQCWVEPIQGIKWE